MKAQISLKQGQKRNPFVFIVNPGYGCQRATFASRYSRFRLVLEVGVNLNQATGDLNELKTAGKGVLELITERQM